MTFFVTSTGSGARGGDLGGLAGADAKCQALASAAGGGDHTWRAYLSTSRKQRVDARDRIGNGPWHNFAGALVASDLVSLHNPGLIEPGRNVMDEKGRVLSAQEHDVLTGSNDDGTAQGNDCNDWTDGTANFEGRVGHGDGQPYGKWNSAHSNECYERYFIEHLGRGYFFCFAID